MVLLTLGVPALVGAWVWILPDRQPTPLLVVSVADYASPVPPNAFAAEDAARFHTAFDDYDNVRARYVDSARSSSDLLRTLESYLTEVTPGGPNKDVVLIYLSAHGLVNDQGAPCLMLPGHNPLDAATWLPVADLLEAISRQAAARSCRAVLMLDAQRIDDAWRMGVPLNGFSLALDSLLAASPPRECIVMTASSGLQAALGAPEISGTPFGYYAALGIRGKADDEGDQNDIVSLAELEQFLAKHVDAWVSQHRGVRQQPRLYGETAEIELADVAGRAELPTTPWKAAIDQQQYNDVFKRVGALEAARAYASQPLEWAELQFLLERLDQESLAGSAYATAARSGALSEVNAILSRLESQREPRYDYKPLTLAMAHPADGESSSTLPELWQAWLKDPAATKVPPGYDEAARFVWAQLTQGDGWITGGDLAKHLQFCDLAGAPAGVDFAEIALVRLLNSYVDWPSPVLDVGIPRALLAACRESETLAAGDDPRQHYVLGPSLRSADERLAQALDDVLVGDDEAMVDAQAILEELSGDRSYSHPKLKELAEAVLRAIRARDDALATLPYLEQWATRLAKYDQAYRQTHSTASTLSRQTLELAEQLDDIMAKPLESPDAAALDRLNSQQAELRSNLDRLWQGYASRVAHAAVDQEGADSTTSVELPHLVRCMTRFSGERALLHQQWIDRLTRDGAGDAKAAQPPVAADAQQGDLDYLRWLASEGIQPYRDLLARQEFSLNSSDGESSGTIPVVDQSASSEVAALAIAKFGGRLRRLLLDAKTACSQLSEQSTAMVAEAPAGEARLGFSRADVLSRRLASLAGRSLQVRGAAAPTELLHRLDTQAWLLWHGRRAIDDCWGPVDSHGDSTPYFQLAAAQAADDAERLFPAATFAVRELRAQRQAVEKLITNWDPLTPQDLLVSEDGGAFQSHSMIVQGEPNLRPGRTAVFLTKDGELFKTYTSQSRDLRRVGVDGRQGAELGSLLRPEQLGSVPVLHANVLFRGHVRPKLLSVGRGVSIDWRRPPRGEATVMVRGDSTQTSQIIFVVDCSNSMDDGGWDRLKDGREAVTKILGQLINRDEKFRVGLIFYGRRAKWVEQGKKYEIVWLNKESYNGFPGNDVETALPPRHLDRNTLNQIQAKLAEAKAFGETPLYLSLVYALEQFDLGTPGPCHLIAITDGVDWVAEDQPIAKKTHTDVIRAMAAKNSRITLDIIEFGGKGTGNTEYEKNKWKVGRRDLRTLVGSITPRGSFNQITDSDKLADKVRDSLRLDRYRVELANSAGAADPQKDWRELGEISRVQPESSPSRYRVRLQTHDSPPAEIELEGGEAVELVYRRPPQNRLVYRIFDKGDMDDMGEKKVVNGFIIASHVPRLQVASPPVFRVSIQSEDELRFCRRPDVVFARVGNPLEEDRPYYFFDRQFEAGQPMPMLNLLARQWSGGKFADLDVSFVMDASGFNDRWTAIPQIGAATIDSHGAALQVKSEIAGQGYQVVINEQHGADAIDYPLHVQLDPPPERVSRTHFESRRMAQHIFQYSTQPTSPKVRILSRREIESSGASASFKGVELPRR